MYSFMGKQIHRTTGTPNGAALARQGRPEGGNAGSTRTVSRKPLGAGRHTTGGEGEGLEVAASEDSARAVDNSSAEEN